LEISFTTFPTVSCWEQHFLAVIVSCLALTISIATIYHEIAQEIADFYVLTKHYNIKLHIMALCLNFLGGLSIMIGAIFILSFNILNSMVSSVDPSFIFQ
jgi:zinc transporter ZupT